MQVNWVRIFKSLFLFEFKIQTQMFRKGLITAVLASLTFAVSIQNNENEDQVMALSGDLNLPVSFHVG